MDKVLKPSDSEYKDEDLSSLIGLRGGYAVVIVRETSPRGKGDMKLN
jgi:hypothetical protein